MGDQDTAALQASAIEAELLPELIRGLTIGTVVAVRPGNGVSLRAVLAAGVETVYALAPDPSQLEALRAALSDTPAVHVLDTAIAAPDRRGSMPVDEQAGAQDARPSPGSADGDQPFNGQAASPPASVIRSLDSLAADGVIPAEIGLLHVGTDADGLAVLQGLGRLAAAIVRIAYGWSQPGRIASAPERTAEAIRLMARHGYSNFALAKLHDGFETLHVNDRLIQPGDRGSIVFVHDTVFPRSSATVFAAASAAQTRLIERTQALAAETRQQRTLVEQLTRAAARASIVTRLEMLEEQELALEAYIQATRGDGPWQWVTQQLGVLYQHPPIPFHVPEHYLQVERLPALPTISIVTPMLNGAQFIQFTLDSVLDQEYPSLEYMIQDGGSKDEALSIVERYRDRLTEVRSERDTGMAQAINRGFSHATGDIMAYLNADDLLLPGSLHFVAAYFAAHPEVDVVYGHRVLIDAEHQEVGRWVLPRHDDDVLSWTDYVPQESLFWRRSIWERVGGAMDESFRFALDWDMLLRFRDAGATFVRLPRFVAAFRVHGSQKTATELSGVGADEIRQIREREAGGPVTPSQIRHQLEPYIRRHKLYHKLYRLGVLAY